MAHTEVDVCGLVLYSAFFLLVCARVRPFLEGGNPLPALSPTDKLKLGFHICLLGSSLLELVHYAVAVAVRRSTFGGYACHLVALWLSLVSFSLVIILWSNTLNPLKPPTRSGAIAGIDEDSTGLLRRSRCCSSCRLSGTAKFVGTIDAAVAITTIAVLWTGSVPAYSRPYLILVVAHSVTLFLLAAWLIMYGARLQRRVMDHPRWEPLDQRQRLKILCRINGVLVVCAACFLVRVAVLSSALFARSRHRAEEMNRLFFELLARWVSGLVPGVALLHIMCKTKRPREERTRRQRGQRRTKSSAMNGSQPLEEPLLPERDVRGENGVGGDTYVKIGKGFSPLPMETAPAGGSVATSDAHGRSVQDSFVYHNVMRVQQEGTVTTI